MKAIIKDVKFQKEYDTKFGMMYLHKISYDDKTAFYSSKKKEQTYFVKGQEAVFTEETQTGKNGEFLKIKPERKGKFSPYNRELKKEQSRYSGFAVSYCKDLIVAGRLDLDKWENKSKEVFQWMVEMDKSIEDDNS